MTRPARVLFVIHSPVFGGPHNQALRLARPLEARGFETVVLLPDGPGNAVERLHGAEVEVVRLPLHRLRATADPRTQIRFLAGFVPEVGAIRRLIDALEIDIVQIGGLVNPHAAFAARAARRPVVWQLLDTRAQPGVSHVAMGLVRALATVVMPTGTRVLSAFPGAGRLAGRIVPFVPPVDTSLFQPRPDERAEMRRALGLADGDRVVGTVANVNPQKGIRGLVTAFAAVHRREPTARLVIVGAEYEAHRAYSRAVREAIASGGLREDLDVRFVGARDDVPDVLQAMDVWVLASEPRSEGIPTAMLEAMATGLPVVATDVGGVLDVVAPGRTGAVVPPGDPHALGEAISTLLADPALGRRMGEAARSEVERRWSVERCAEVHAVAYERALAARRRPGT